MLATLEQIYEEVKTTREILTGNGEPDKGLCVRHARLEERQKILIKDIADIKSDMQKIVNRKSSANGKFLGMIPKRIIELTWVTIVRGVIIVTALGISWAGCNAERIYKLLETFK